MNKFITLIALMVAFSANAKEPKWQEPGTSCAKSDIGNVRIKNSRDVERCTAKGWVVIPEKNTDAIEDLVPIYLGRLFTIVDAPVVNGNSATVHATILNRSCNLTLVKRVLENESSRWILTEQDCKKIK